MPKIDPTDRTAPAAPAVPQRLTRWRQALRPSSLLAALMAGSISGIVGVVVALSFAALIFSGDWSSDLPRGVGIALVSASIVRLGVALFSSFPGAIADLDERAAAIVAVMAVAVGDRLPTPLDASALPTLLTTIGLTSVLTALFLLLLGSLRVGELIRFLPYPVVGGFLAGTGWLLAQGALQVMTDLPITLTTLPQLWQPVALLHWLPGAIFAGLLLIGMRRSSHSLILPGAILAAIALFYLILWLTQTSLAAATQSGWLLNVSFSGGLWQLPDLRTLEQVQWGVVGSQVGNMGAIALINATALLLNAAGIELATEQEIDLNQELRVTGWANLFTGLTGGMVGCHVLADSVLAYRMGARSALAGLVSVGVMLGVLLLGFSVLTVMPKPVLGGLLLLLGLDLLVEWVIEAQVRLPRADYGLVLVILGVIVTLGFLQGVGVGLAIALVLFVLNYSRIPVTRHLLSGATHPSRVVRPRNHTQLLQQQGDQIEVMVLQGFLFFGTAQRLLAQVRQRLGDSPEERLRQRQRPPLRFVVLDFRLVNGIDSSAVMSFLKLQQLANQQEFVVVFAHLSATVQQQLQQDQQFANAVAERVFPDGDRAVQWCEEQILAEVPWRRRRTLPLALQLDQWFPDGNQSSLLMDGLQAMELAAGEVLFQQGEPAEALYFIEDGEVSVMAAMATDDRRLQTISAGATVGEMDFCLGNQYQTTAIAQQPCTLYRLSRTALQHLQQNHPQAAAHFQGYLNQLLAERLSLLYREIEDLL